MLATYAVEIPSLGKSLTFEQRETQGATQAARDLKYPRYPPAGSGASPLPPINTHFDHSSFRPTQSRPSVGKKAKKKNKFAVELHHYPFHWQPPTPTPTTHALSPLSHPTTGIR